MADKKISELDLALQIDNDAEFPMSQDNAGEPTTFKGRITLLATKIAEDMTFSNLRTTSKKLVGAINELLSLGSPIIIGTTAPTSSIGADKNLYIQYTEGTGGADDEVDGIYAKIDGAWCEISTGGGGGTTDYEDLSNKPQVNSVELVGNKSLDDLGIMPASLSKTVSGSIAHFTDGADNIPVKSLKSEIVAVQSGSGTPSPSNQRAISGFDSGVITRHGKNLIPMTVESVKAINTLGTWSGNAYTYNNVVYTIQTDASGNITGISANGTANETSFFNIATNFILQKGSYILNGCPAGGGTELARLQVNTPTLNIDTGLGVNITLTEVYKTCICFIRVGSGYNPNGRVFKPMVRVASDTDNTFAISKGNNYTFPFGLTVYGGHFNNKGNLVVTHGYYLADGSETFAMGTATAYRYFDMSMANPLNVNAWEADVISNIFKKQRQGYPYCQMNGVKKVRFVFDINDTSVTSVADLQALLTNTNAQIVYPLTTSTTLAITSQDIPTLLGKNNIFSNTGDITVDYYTDNADEIVEVAKATASTPLNNYSTDEQVVGTWIDGSTLYQKSFVFTSSLTITDDWVSTPFNISGLDKIIDGIIWRVSSGGSVYIDTNVDGDNIRISTKSKNTNFAIGSVLTIRYTKSST